MRIAMLGCNQVMREDGSRVAMHVRLRLSRAGAQGGGDARIPLHAWPCSWPATGLTGPLGRLQGGNLWIGRCSGGASGPEPGDLRPMGSSRKGILTGRMRHGRGQHCMGSHPLFPAATAVFRMGHPPPVIGGLAMLRGCLEAALKRRPRQSDAGLIRIIRADQRRALRMGKARAIAAIDAEQAAVFAGKSR